MIFDIKMPTILIYRGYRFYFYSHEPNEPAHIHVDKDNLSAKFWLSPVFLARNKVLTKYIPSDSQQEEIIQEIKSSL